MPVDPRTPFVADPDVAGRLVKRLAHRADLAIEAQATIPCPVCDGTGRAIASDGTDHGPCRNCEGGYVTPEKYELLTGLLGGIEERDKELERELRRELRRQKKLGQAQAKPPCPMCGEPSEEMPEELGGGAYLCDACTEAKGRDTNKGRPREGQAPRGRMTVNGQPYQANTQVWIDGEPYTIDTVEGDACILLDENGQPRMMPLAKVVEGLKQGAPDKDASRTAQGKFSTSTLIKKLQTSRVVTQDEGERISSFMMSGLGMESAFYGVFGADGYAEKLAAFEEEWPGAKKWRNAGRTAQSWARPAPDAHLVCWFYHPGNPKPVTEVTAEVAATATKRAVGLSDHETLHPATGMLFLCPSCPPERTETYHVGGVSFPFDLVFIRRDGTVGKIVHNIQPKDPGHWSYNRTASVIELVGGFCRSHGIEVGDKVGYGKVARTAQGDPVSSMIDDLRYGGSVQVRDQSGKTFEVRSKYKDGATWYAVYQDGRKQEDFKRLSDDQVYGWLSSLERVGSRKQAFRALQCPKCGANRNVMPSRFADQAGQPTQCIGCGYQGDQREFDRQLPKTAQQQLTAQDVDGLPVGTIVVSMRGGLPDTYVVVTESGTLPISVLPEQGNSPDHGVPAAEFGDQFQLVRTGKGTVPNHGAAQRAAINWSRTAQIVEPGMAECKSCGFFSPGHEFIEDDASGEDQYPPKVSCPNCGESSIKFASHKTAGTFDGSTACSSCGATPPAGDWKGHEGECEACAERRDGSRRAQMSPIPSIPSAKPSEDSGEKTGAPEPPPTCQSCGRDATDGYEMPGEGLLCPECADDYVGSEGGIEEEAAGITHDPLRSLTEASRKRAGEGDMATSLPAAKEWIDRLVDLAEQAKGELDATGEPGFKMSAFIGHIHGLRYEDWHHHFYG